MSDKIVLSSFTADKDIVEEFRQRAKDIGQPSQDAFTEAMRLYLERYPPGYKYDNKKDWTNRLLELKREGKNYKEIVTLLNIEGYTTRDGKKITVNAARQRIHILSRGET